MSEFPNWWFKEKQPNDKANENSNGEHFNTLDTEGKAQSFVRESFQNSIDGAAKAGSTVKIRIFVSEDSAALPAELALAYFGGMFEHLSACRNEIPGDFELMEKSPCKFLVFEDFGTTGLTGDVSAWDESQPGTEENHFYHFYRTVGRSGKKGDNLGRWGIGKFVFLMASGIRSMFGYTVRAMPAGGVDQLLMGQTTLRYHSLGGRSYVNDGWFSLVDPANGLSMPFNEAEVLERFCRDWAVTRSAEPGLTVVVPYAEEIEVEDVLYSVVSEYLGKLIDGSLIVEVESPSLGNKIEVNEQTIAELISARMHQPRWGTTQRVFRALKWYVDVGIDTPVLALGEGGVIKTTPDWNSVKFDDETLNQIRESLDATGFASVRTNVQIRRTGAGSAESAHFDVVLAIPEDGNARPQYSEYFRNWLRISGRRMGSQISGVETYLMVAPSVLGDLLGDSEGPAHTEWSEARDKFRGKYVNGPAWLRFVKSAPRKISDSVFGHARQRDYQALDDLFPCVPQDDSGNGKSGGGGSGKKTPPRPPRPPRGTPPGIDLRPLSDGFVVRVEDPTDLAGLKLEMAFDVPAQDPFRRWHAADFVAEELHLSFDRAKASVIRAEKNVLELDIVDALDFEIQVTGFNDIRDLVVRAIPDRVGD
jgi:hypothetical protein